VFDKEARLQTAFSDAEANARVTAFRISKNDLASYNTESLIESVFTECAVDLVDVELDYIWHDSEVSPSYITETSSYAEITLHATCNESGKYLGDLTKTFVQGTSSRTSSTWVISRIYNAPSDADDLELIAGYRAEFESDIRADAAKYNAKISEHRERLRTSVTQIITDRAKKLNSINKAALAANIHLTPAPDPIVIPMEPKALNMATLQKRQAAGAPVAMLAADSADELVNTIRSFALALERQPVLAGALATKDEEALRDILLFILNSQWKGAVTGETFVGRGKTDLCFRWENADAFIGECKMWNGPKAFTRGIDQLLGYTVWRDTRAGLILFVKNKRDVTAAIESAAECIRSHPNFVKTGTAEQEFIIRSEHDAERHIHLSLITVHVQTHDDGDPQTGNSTTV
jgi:hypothetical protein